MELEKRRVNVYNCAAIVPGDCSIPRTESRNAFRDDNPTVDYYFYLLRFTVENSSLRNYNSSPPIALTPPQN